MYDQILLIDDDPIANFINARLVKAEARSTTIKVFEQAKEALHHLKANAENSFCIFLDIHMPEMNGWEFLEALEQLGIPLGGPLFILTSSIEEGDQQRAKSYAAVREFISKPLTREDLAQLDL